MQVLYLPVSAITPYDGNAKEHPDYQIEQIAESIQQFGFQDPVAVWGEENLLVEGHGRLLAAQKLGLDTVPAIRLDGLTDEQRRAYALVHNQLTMNSDFDIEQLRVELESIECIDMQAFDFSFDSPEEPETFSMDELEPVQGFDAATDDREYFESAFTFPAAYKSEITSYLRKNKARITQQIIDNAKLG